MASSTNEALEAFVIRLGFIQARLLLSALPRIRWYFSPLEVLPAFNVVTTTKAISDQNR